MECIGDNDSNDSHNYSSDGNPCEIKSNRTCTDKSFFIILGLSLITLFACLGYCISHGDLDRIIKGYDNCGNICGKNNINTDRLNFECYGLNMEQKKYLFYQVVRNDYYARNKYVAKICVKSCNGLKQHKDVFSNRCFEKDEIMKDNDISELYNQMKFYSTDIILMSIFATLLSFAIMLMFRYKTGLTVNIILFGFSILCISTTIFLWVRLRQINKSATHSEYNTFLALSITGTIFTCILVIIVIAITKRLLLVIAIFKESAKAIADMPLLLLQPLVTCLSILLIIICGIYTTLWLTSSGYLTKLSMKNIDHNDRKPGSLYYEISNVEIFVIYYNAFIIMWMIQFVVGCQHIIVGGSVATWFFTRNKIELDSPIKTSAFNLVRYHLGTVCLGSLIITIVGIVKAVVRSLKTLLNNKDSIIACILYCFLKYFLEIIELFLKFFSRNAYIQTAIHGYSFCKGGKRAFHLLVKNIFQVIVINSVGDYILYITKFFVSITTMLLTALLLWVQGNTEHMMSAIMIIGCISCFIAHSFLTIYEMTIDTIFLCFCEDCEVNDGITRPYFMSRNLMEIVDYGNKMYSSSNNLQFSDRSPKREILQGA